MNIRLICLDFDGTAVDYDGEVTFFHPAVAEELNRLGKLGVEWCTNSGRSREDQERILEASQTRGLCHMPAAIVSSEAFIYDRDDNGLYISHEPWNTRTLALLRQFHAEVQSIMKPLLEKWGATYELDIRLGPEHTVFCVTGQEQRVDAFAAEAAEAVSSLRDAMITRNGGWVVVLPDHMGKGNMLRQYMLKRGLSREHVLAMGDHLNDISMLDGRVAHWVACPSDAQPLVVEVVRAAQGWVASKPGALGTAEILAGLRPFSFGR